VPEQLSLRGAFRMALQANKDVAVTSLRADQSEFRIMGAEGEFDVSLFAETARGRSNVPVEGVPLDREDSAVGASTAGLQKRFVTGTDVEIAATTDYDRELSDTSILNPEYDTGARLTVEQDLLRDFGIGINRTDIMVSQNNWQISKEELRDRVINTLFQVEQTYWDLYFSLMDLQVREKQLERAEALVRRARAYVDVGSAPPLDITRAESSAASQRVAIIQARNRVQALRHQLLRLLGVSKPRQFAGELELVDQPPVTPFKPSLEEALSTAREHRPDYRQAELDIENADLNRRFFKNQRLPRLKAFGQYELAGLDEEFSSSVDVLEDGDYGSWLVGLRFEFPIPNRVARSDYQVARLESRVTRLQLEALWERITREVADALTDLEAAAGRVETSEQARRLAERLLQAEEKSFSLGRSNSLDVLDAQAAVAAAERDEVRAKADYATAAANLLRAEGTLLRVKGVRME
jgi:outer membrane protein TolC